MIPRIARSKADLVEILRQRRDELDISHETIDALTGLAEGYTSKLLAPKPIKNLGPMSFGAILGALALGVAAVLIVEDPEQARRMAARWQKRKRPPVRRLLRTGRAGHEKPGVTR